MGRTPTPRSLCLSEQPGRARSQPARGQGYRMLHTGHQDIQVYRLQVAAVPCTLYLSRQPGARQYTAGMTRKGSMAFAVLAGADEEEEPWHLLFL